MASTFQRLPADEVRLPEDEALAIVAYTFDLGINSESANGEDNIFFALNNVLRERNGPKMQLLKPFLTYLMRGMSLLPPIAARVYRGVPGTVKALEVVRSNYKVNINSSFGVSYLKYLVIVKIIIDMNLSI